jgi:hypothetical protein
MEAMQGSLKPELYSLDAKGYETCSLVGAVSVQPNGSVHVVVWQRIFDSAIEDDSETKSDA